MAQSPATVIEATDAASLTASVGQTILVHGTIERTSVSQVGYARLFLRDTKFNLYIASANFKAHADWNLAQWEGKECYAVGINRLYRGQPQLVLTAPSQLGTDPAALKIPAAGAATKAASTVPDDTLQVQSEQAALTQLHLQIKSTKTNRLATLAAESMELHWDALSSRSTSTSKLRFDGSSYYSTKGREPADAAVTLVMAEHNGAWPEAKVARVTRAQSGETATWPTTLTMAVLLETTFNGWKLPPGLKLCGELTSTGSIDGGQNEIYHFLQTPALPEEILIVPLNALPALQDQWLQGPSTRLAECRIFGVQSLDDVGIVLEALSSKAWEPQFTLLGNLQKSLTAKGVNVLRSPEVRTALLEMTRFCPYLLNARVLQAAAESKSPTLYSLNGAAHRLYALHQATWLDSALLQSDTPEGRRKAKEMKDALLALKPLCLPKFKLVIEKLDDLLDTTREATRFESKDTSPRARKARTAHTDAVSKAATEVALLESELGLGYPAK